MVLQSSSTVLKNCFTTSTCVVRAACVLSGRVVGEWGGVQKVAGSSSTALSIWQSTGALLVQVLRE